MNENEHSKELKTIKVVTLLTALGILLAILAVSIITYWSFTGTDVLRFHKSPIPVQPRFVKSAGIITLDADFCKLTSTPGRLVESLVSTNSRLLVPTVTESQLKGCYHYPVKIPIPTDAPPGKYHINFTVVYKTNPFHSVTEDINSETFTVGQ